MSIGRIVDGPSGYVRCGEFLE